jgi:Helitron helicase-like domain at N-terminus
MTSSNVQTYRATWPTTQSLLTSITPEDLERAARQAERYEPITDPKVKELLKMVNIVGRSAVGSDEKKSYMLVELKSSMVYYGCPTIFLTINPGERHSPLALYYAGEEFDIKNFHPQLYNASLRLKKMLDNPLAVLEYFHNTVNTLIETMLKGNGLFGELLHYYGPIEYQGRGTPHTHLAVQYQSRRILTDFSCGSTGQSPLNIQGNVRKTISNFRLDCFNMSLKLSPNVCLRSTSTIDIMWSVIEFSNPSCHRMIPLSTTPCPSIYMTLSMLDKCTIPITLPPASSMETQHVDHTFLDHSSK